MLQMHNVNNYITNNHEITEVHRLVLPPCRGKLNARVISCTSFVAVDEAGSPSIW